MREDIETALEGVVKSRQLTNILPDELKSSSGYKPRNAMTAFQNQQSQLSTDSTNKVIQTTT
jgi:hypothetical protein